MKPERENIPGLNNGFGPEAPLDYAFSVMDEAAPPVAKRGRKINIGAASENRAGRKENHRQWRNFFWCFQYRRKVLRH